MRISPSYRPLPSTIERLVPGEYPQVQKDLASFPEPVLDLFDGYGVQVAVLGDGQTLAESPALRHLTESEYQKERTSARQLTFEALENSPTDDLMSFAESTTREFRKAGLDFHFGVTRHPLNLDQIAFQQKIPEAHLEDWKANFNELNAGMPSGLFILPHTYDQGLPISENQLRSARETTSEYVEASLGLHRSEDRLVLLHEKFTVENAEEVGNYRLVLHEMGHALDHVLDRMTGFPGFGTLHRQTVDAMYEQDLARAEESSTEEVFTSDRAAENVREYFAEAVEAYLTFPGDPAGEIFRTDNSNPGLKNRNPELYQYVDKIMTTPFDGDAAPPPPARPLLPDFVPDPDTEVYTF